MLKKLIITIIYISILTFNANAGSDGELALKKNQPKEIKDCFENLNRVTFAFNQGLDNVVIKPIAKGYRNLPDPIRKGTSNAVKNLSNLVTIPNNIYRKLVSYLCFWFFFCKTDFYELIHTFLNLKQLF